MPNFIIVDWGTSNFRAVLIDKKFSVVDSISTTDGMLSLKKEEFHPFLTKTLRAWIDEDINIKIYMSGMVGSINGWLETKYLTCSVSLSDLSNNLVKIPNIKEHIYIVPGVKIQKDGLIDLMRGEEIQIFGAMKKLNLKDAVFILPGTHSKWVKLKDEKIVDFKTNMTGEVFSVMSTNTILAKSIGSKVFNEKAFERGIELSLKNEGILNHMFQARSQANNIGENGIYSFLSAIVIGSEIKQMYSLFSPKSVVIVGTSALNDLYTKVLQKYGVQVDTIDATSATVEAMVSIYKKNSKETI